MGRRRQGNCTPQKSNSIEHSVENEENEHSVPDSNRTMKNITNELSDIHKEKSLKKEVMDEIIEKLMEKLQDMVKQKVQNEIRKYQDTTNKKQKQLNELQEDFNKYQSETEETIKKRYMK
jgi:Skp family chaperone for outer membrane proteins